MHFVICVFIALCALAVDVIFTEMLKKWFKLVLLVIGAGSAGYATSIGIRKLAEETSWYAEPKLMNTFYIAAAAWLVVIILVSLSFRKNAPPKRPPKSLRLKPRKS